MKIIILILVGFIFVFPSLVFAGEYMLEKGKGVEVCEAYGKNLNSFPLHNKYTMACERKVNPKFTKFKKPEWKELDIWKNREFLKKVERFLDFSDPDKNLQEWEKHLKDRINVLGATTINTSQIDINNDGKKENVIKYSSGDCPGGNYYGVALLVLNDDENEIDIEKTKPLLQNPRHAKYRDLSEGWDGTMYDIFIYKNKTYFDRWRYAEGSLDEKNYHKYL